MDTPTTPLPDAEAAGARPFSGTPRQYLRIAVWGSLAFHAYLFAGYWAIKRFLAGEPWPTTIWPALAAVVSAALFARFAYRWIMRLDARYGRGSGWELQSVTVKLPWEKPRKK
jgi:hypothetical protein